MPATYRILLVGDFHFGESYIDAGALVAAKLGYSYATEKLRPFVAEADYTIVNLETPLFDGSADNSPLQGKKMYVHWGHPRKTTEALRELGVDAVGLANNHTLDQGVEGLVSTLVNLHAVGLPYFGAGMSKAEAEPPLRIPLPLYVGGGAVSVYGGFQYSRIHDKQYGFYSAGRRPGTAPLKSATLSAPTFSDDFNIFFPHWGRNYEWKTPGQIRLAQAMAEAGYDLVIGHGSHALQELEFSSQMDLVSTSRSTWNLGPARDADEYVRQSLSVTTLEHFRIT